MPIEEQNIDLWGQYLLSGEWHFEFCTEEVIKTWVGEKVIMNNFLKLEIKYSIFEARACHFDL